MFYILSSEITRIRVWKSVKPDRLSRKWVQNEISAMSVSPRMWEGIEGIGRGGAGECLTEVVGRNRKVLRWTIELNSEVDEISASNFESSHLLVVRRKMGKKGERRRNGKTWANWIRSKDFVLWNFKSFWIYNKA